MRWAGLLFSFTLFGCVGSKDQQIPTFEVTKGAFKITIKAEGELAAVKSTAIIAPRNTPTPLLLSWLAPANTRVEQGQVVARFDGTDFSYKVDDAMAEISKTDLSLLAAERSLDIAIEGIYNATEIVELEMSVADRFEPANEWIYSQNEIIDATMDKDYLRAQRSYYREKESSHEKKSDAELALLQAQRSGHEAQLEVNSAGLESLELRAPHDGMFVLERFWFGDPTRVGQTVFPGYKIASIPDLSSMEAKLLIEESEAFGIREGLSVEIFLQAYPQRPLHGTVSSVSKTAQPKQRDNPAKYFSVKVLLDQANSEWMKPGRKLHAVLTIADFEDSIQIPNQAIFQDEDGSWVYVQTDAGFERRGITVGVRSPTQSQVIAGVDTGDHVSLIDLRTVL